eukprot:g36220.t1
MSAGRGKSPREVANYESQAKLGAKQCYNRKSSRKIKASWLTCCATCRPKHKDGTLQVAIVLHFRLFLCI